MLSKITSRILGEGKSPVKLRQKIFDKVKRIVHTNASEEIAPKEADSYIEKVARHAYKVIDSDIAALTASGMTEEEAFELTVVAAVSAGAARVELATHLLKQEYET